MYRIHFDETNACFVLQVLRFWFIWRTVNRSISGPDGDVKLPMYFDTLEEARSHAGKIGLNVLYADKSADAYRSHMGVPA